MSFLLLNVQLTWSYLQSSFFRIIASESLINFISTCLNLFNSVNEKCAEFALRLEVRQNRRLPHSYARSTISVMAKKNSFSLFPRRKTWLFLSLRTSDLKFWLILIYRLFMEFAFLLKNHRLVLLLVYLHAVKRISRLLERTLRFGEFVTSNSGQLKLYSTISSHQRKYKMIVFAKKLKTYSTKNLEKLEIRRQILNL